MPDQRFIFHDSIILNSGELFMKTRHAYIVGSARIPFVKSMTNYSNIPLQDLMTVTLQNLITKLHLDGQVLGDVALGAIINSSANWSGAGALCWPSSDWIEERAQVDK